ncbi:Sigma-adaptin 3A [Coemansia sp. BCRC 34490]|nr:Sigma-adaptin 3A [Coemansia sp. Benny D160-2]KAJ2744408.1 Sigma-adaptin 3A [Coemansia sp. BCRC 34490]
MIHSVMIFNQLGKPRLLKFYEELNPLEQQSIFRDIYDIISKRPDNLCKFVNGSQSVVGTGHRIIYRRYATLFFVFVVDQSESELGIYDLIQVFVEALDRSFENVSELDVIFNFDQVHYILSEIVTAGMVSEVNLTEITRAVNEAKKLAKPPNESGRLGLGSFRRGFS